ncbi:hypothetical protein [Romboutsia lituseburensis]|uniref:hypothetical protein n=1 Tax=Romboutsia lituseburensis TaxID=1537 RepID=UPI00215B5674|nr:hypothetical protein [Romboutsia lituseburensis]MCR8744376.1 hypothetical protein [Romboutsia lituseburensis]
MNSVISTNKKTKNRVEKSIYFYRTDVKKMDNLFKLFKLYNSILQKHKNDLGNSFENLKDSGLILKNLKDKNRYHFLDVISIDNEKIECLLYSLRDSAFPYLFNIFTGEKREIPHNMDDTLMEQTHFIVYPKHNIIASEFNYYGCRIERLSDIFELVFKEKNILELAPILNTDSVEELLYKGIFKGFDLKVAYPALGQIQSALNLGILPEFDNNFTSLDNMFINIGINDSSGLNLKDKNKFIKNIIKLVDSIKNQFSDEDGFIKSKCPLKLAKVHTKPLSQTKGLTVDLFEEKLLSKVYPVKLNDGSKYLNSSDMFKCIEEAFSYNKKTILNEFSTLEIATTSI